METIEASIKVLHRNPRNKKYGRKSIIYFEHADESIFENFGNRVARPVDVYQHFLPEVAKKLGLPETTKFRWSQYAGCSCPCSPGFICNEVKGKDIWVTLKGAPVTNNNPNDEAHAENRKAQLVQQLSLEQQVAGKTN